MITFDDIYKALQEELTSDWVVGRTVNRACITLKNKHVSEKIQKRTCTDIKVQFWSSDIKNIKFEFASDKKYIDLRERLASSFEEYIFAKSYPAWLRKSKVKGCSTVANVSLSEKEDATAKALVKGFCKFISDKIDKWALEILPELLPHEITNENLTPNDEPQDNTYLPSKEDFESAYRMLARSGESISIDAVWDQIEVNAAKESHLLKSDWRVITEANIKVWAMKR